jgi:hypothetical protein
MYRNGYMLVALLLFFTLGCAEAEWVSKKLDEMQKKQEQKKSLDSTGSTSGKEEISSSQVSASQVTDPTKREELTFTLADNSVIVGKFLQEELVFNSQFGELKVKGKDIASFNEGILHLEDGTTLQGSLALEEVGIISEFGEIQIKVADITGIVR